MKLKELTFEVRWNDWNPLDFVLIKKSSKNTIAAKKLTL